jgi:hypothetical protein
VGAVKRAFVATIGVLAVLAGLDASFFAIKASEDFSNHAVSFWVTALGETIICATAFVSFGIGMRFLHFGWTGRDDPKPTWMRAALISTGMFFPGFIFSLPLTLFCASRIWRNPDIALPISMSAGLISSILCSAWFPKKRKASRQ